jgi:hypothetical protein
MIEKPRDMPPFTKEQLGYLKNLLAIEPCHITGEHEPNHNLKGIICNFQRGEAWEHAMTELSFDPKNPARKIHDDCFWCHSKESKHAQEHREWAAMGPNYQNPALFKVVTIIPKPRTEDAPRFVDRSEDSGGEWVRCSDRAIFAHKDIVNGWGGDETFLEDRSIVVKSFYGDKVERELEAKAYAATVTNYLKEHGFIVEDKERVTKLMRYAAVVVTREY